MVRDTPQRAAVKPSRPMKFRSVSVVPWPVTRNLAMARIARACTSWIGFAKRLVASSSSPAARVASAVSLVASMTRAASAGPRGVWDGSAQKLAGARGETDVRLQARTPTTGPLCICVITLRKVLRLAAFYVSLQNQVISPFKKSGPPPMQIDGHVRSPSRTLKSPPFKGMDTLQAEGMYALPRHGDIGPDCA